MPVFQRNAIKGAIPNYIKLILLLSVILGFGLRGYWHKIRGKYVEISNVHLQNNFPASLDILFTVENKSTDNIKQSVIVKAFDSKKSIVASKLLKLNFTAASKKNYRVLLQKFEQPLMLGDTLSASVELYQASFFTK